MKLRALLLAWLGVAWLAAFSPDESNFANRYQYELLRSWQEKGQLWNSHPAVLSRDAISMDFQSRTGETQMLDFDLSAGKIYNARERFAITNGILPDAYAEQARRVGGFLFRFNTGIQQACFEYSDMTGIVTGYNGQTGVSALEALWRDYGSNRLPDAGITAESLPGTVVFHIGLGAGKKFTLTLPAVGIKPVPIQSAPLPVLPPATPAIVEIQPSTPVPAPSESIPAPTIPETPPLTVAPLNPAPAESSTAEMDLRSIMSEIDKLESRMSSADDATVFAHDPYEGLPSSPARTLRNYIYREYKVKRSLQNPRFTDAASALREAFPNAHVIQERGVWNVTRPALGGRFGGDLRLMASSSRTGTMFSVDPTCTPTNNGFILPDGEQIDAGNLSPDDIVRIAPFLTEVLYEHRALGTRVFHHLLLPDGVPTTIVFKGIEREMFDFDSYAQMLLLLNQIWQGRPVYCHLTHFNKANGYIEFYAELAVPYPDNDHIDFAEARFHLDNTDKIDCSMVFLFPDIQFTRNP